MNHLLHPPYPLPRGKDIELSLLHGFIRIYTDLYGFIPHTTLSSALTYVVVLKLTMVIQSFQKNMQKLNSLDLAA